MGGLKGGSAGVREREKEGKSVFMKVAQISQILFHIFHKKHINHIFHLIKFQG